MDAGRSDSFLLWVVVAVLAIVAAVGLGGAMLMTGTMMGGGPGGGMMGGGFGAGAGVVVLIVLAVIVAIVALAFAFRSPRGQRPMVAVAPPMAYVPVPPAPTATSAPPAAPAGDAARLERLQEAAVVRALDEDERRLYLQVREAGGTALQRDLVASGTFSKAKVTRLLDKLERRGLVVRERYGATNRVRLTWKGPPAG